MLESMFHLHLPILEKILRPIIVYIVLILFLRLFGKRELAQLNPFDLVVLLSLSNTVQNAIIGEDNSVTGGVIGAFALLAINYVFSCFLFRSPKLNQALEGDATTLIEDGKVIQKAMDKEKLTHLELLSVLHKQGVDTIEEVRKCVLEPNGTFYVEQLKPSAQDKDLSELTDSVRALHREIASLRTQLDAQLSKGA